MARELPLLPAMSPKKRAIVRKKVLIGASEDRPLRGGLGAANASPASTLLFQGNAAHCGAGFFLDFAFAIGAPAPEGVGQAIFNGFLQVVVCFRIVCVALAEGQRPVV